MAQHGGGKRLIHHGKALVCLNPKCNRNHYIHNYPNAIDQEKIKIHVTAREKWKAEAEARKSKQVR